MCEWGTDHREVCKHRHSRRGRSLTAWGPDDSWPSPPTSRAATCLRAGPPTGAVRAPLGNSVDTASAVGQSVVTTEGAKSWKMERAGCRSDLRTPQPWQVGPRRTWMDDCSGDRLPAPPAPKPRDLQTRPSGTCVSVILNDQSATVAGSLRLGEG